jgi:uncharacterized protein (DUF1501 family)
MKETDRTEINRRQFMRKSACASLGATGMVSTLAHLSLLNSALANQAALVGDYKALVCIFLFGGMDSNNMLVPKTGHPARADYDNARGILAIPNGTLATINPDNTTDPYGLHPDLSPMADLFNAGELAFVANTGSLAYPVASREDFINETVPLPPQLFSHSDQQVQWQSSIPDKPFQSGWGGRIADIINGSYNDLSQVSMCISLGGLNEFQVSQSGGIVQYAATTSGAISLSGYGTNYQNALNADGSYKTGTTGQRLKAYEDIMRHTHDHLFEEGYNKVVRRARESEATVNGALVEAAASGVDFDAMFMNADTKLGDQLKMVSRLIAGRNCLGNRRQIFFCSQGGFDTHSDQNGDLSNLYLELGTGVKAFSDTLSALGVNDRVLTCTHSDFTRTLTPNGEDFSSSGSDHAWGGHQIVMGGPVNGKNIYGTFPSLAVGADNDTDRNRGRWIPSTSVDQYGAVCARWMDVESSALELIFPNLGRFNDPFGATANLGFVTIT